MEKGYYLINTMLVRGINIECDHEILNLLKF